MCAAPRSQRGPDAFRGLFQCFPARSVRVARAEPQAEAVSIETRENVQVNVEDLLACRLAVGGEKVDPFAIEPPLVERGGDLLGDADHVRSCIFRQIGQICGVIFWHHQDVTGIDGLHVHKSRAAPVAKDRR